MCRFICVCVCYSARTLKFSMSQPMWGILYHVELLLINMSLLLHKCYFIVLLAVASPAHCKHVTSCQHKVRFYTTYAGFSSRNTEAVREGWCFYNCLFIKWFDNEVVFLSTVFCMHVLNDCSSATVRLQLSIFSKWITNISLFQNCTGFGDNSSVLIQRFFHPFVWFPLCCFMILLILAHCP